jgi:hypothetical protein
MHTKILLIVPTLLLLLLSVTLKAQRPEIRYMCGFDEAIILNTEKGMRPVPRAYLDTLYIRRHIDAFADGASYLVPKDILDRFGRDRLGRSDGQFVMAKQELDALLLKAEGKIEYIEKELGIPAAAWKDRQIVRIDVANPRELRLRIPSGNEGGVNELWLPGGYLPNGIKEAVCDPIEIGRYFETIVDLK